MPNSPSFSLDSVLPLVARLIKEIYDSGQPFATHREIASRLLSDPAGHRLAETAFREQAQPRSIEHVASNMVAWFSASYRKNIANLPQQFERERVSGCYAYTPSVRIDVTSPRGEFV